MFDHAIADPKTLLMGVITGVVFGFLLHKGGVTRYNVVVNQFRFKDFTVLKTMLTAIVVGAIGIWGMKQAGMIEGLQVKGAALAMNGIGGAIFGVGMVVLGYCPGTALAALGSGSRDAGVGVIGMLFGAAAYAEAFPWISSRFESVANLGKVTFADVLHVSPWLLIVGLAVFAIVLFVLLEQLGPKPKAA